MIKSKTAIIAGVVLFIALGWFVVFGDEALAPWLDSQRYREEARAFLENCPRDEMRCLNSSPNDFYLSFGVVFSSKKPWFGGALPVEHTLFWQRLWPQSHHPAFLHNQIPYLSMSITFTDDQIAQIKAFLASLPAPIHSPDDSPDTLRFHLAFWQGDELRIYDYPASKAIPGYSKLCHILGFPLNDLNQMNASKHPDP